jgi:hypothetical protein
VIKALYNAGMDNDLPKRIRPFGSSLQVVSKKVSVKIGVFKTFRVNLMDWQELKMEAQLLTNQSSEVTLIAPLQPKRMRGTHVQSAEVAVGVYLNNLVPGSKAICQLSAGLRHRRCCRNRLSAARERHSSETRRECRAASNGGRQLRSSDILKRTLS